MRRIEDLIADACIPAVGGGLDPEALLGGQGQVEETPRYGEGAVNQGRGEWCGGCGDVEEAKSRLLLAI